MGRGLPEATASPSQSEARGPHASRSPIIATEPGTHLSLYSLQVFVSETQAASGHFHRWPPPAGQAQALAAAGGASGALSGPRKFPSLRLKWVPSDWQLTFPPAVLHSCFHV